MNPELLQEKDDELIESGHPHLSHSRISRYQLCPEQYRLYYISKLRPKVPSATLVFGQLIHQALAKLFEEQGDPVKFFETHWGALEMVPLAFGKKDSWAALKVIGRSMLGKFVAEEHLKITNIKVVERPFELSISGLDTPFVGVVDLVADVSETPTVVDFKTAGAKYAGYEAPLSDQLSAYQLAEPGIKRLALCVLVKTKNPQIEWFFTKRSDLQLTEYLVKLGQVAQDIRAGRFFKRPGMWCTWCDYLPVCLGNETDAKETLVKL